MLVGEPDEEVRCELIIRNVLIIRPGAFNLIHGNRKVRYYVPSVLHPEYYFPAGMVRLPGTGRSRKQLYHINVSA